MTISSEHTKQIMLELRKVGLPDELIGRVFGMTRQAVHSTLGTRDPALPLLVPARVKSLPDLNPLATDADKALPQALYAWRRRRGLSQTEAAPILGISNSTWSTWERGSKACMLPAIVMSLLDALDKIDGIEK